MNQFPHKNCGRENDLSAPVASAGRVVLEWL